MAALCLVVDERWQSQRASCPARLPLCDPGPLRQTVKLGACIPNRASSETLRPGLWRARELASRGALFGQVIQVNE
eukprot:SAG11_NODE_2934_length_2828_cov_1.446684_6_plen_76_part_00